jgi:hypothetical protein
MATRITTAATPIMTPGQAAAQPAPQCVDGDRQALGHAHAVTTDSTMTVAS